MNLEYTCICSAQSENLRNLEIALRILRIPRLRSNLEIAQAIWRLRNTCAQSGDCVTRVRNLRTLPVVIYCVARRMEDILDKRRLPP